MNQDQRELLELAAYAIGLHQHRWCAVLNGMMKYTPQDGPHGPIFNSLTDKADAFDLMVKLKLKVVYRTVDVDVSLGNVSTSEHTPTYKNEEEATCMALTRAAAAIGKQMKESGE